MHLLQLIVHVSHEWFKIRITARSVLRYSSSKKATGQLSYAVLHQSKYA